MWGMNEPWITSLNLFMNLQRLWEQNSMFKLLHRQARSSSLNLFMDLQRLWQQNSYCTEESKQIFSGRKPQLRRENSLSSIVSGFTWIPISRWTTDMWDGSVDNRSVFILNLSIYSNWNRKLDLYFRFLREMDFTTLVWIEIFTNSTTLPMFTYLT